MVTPQIVMTINCNDNARLKFGWEQHYIKLQTLGIFLHFYLCQKGFCLIEYRLEKCFITTEIRTDMKTCNKIAVTVFSFGVVIGTACAQEAIMERPAEPSRQLAEEETQYVRYGRRMRQNTSHDNYCGNSPCSDYRRANRMSNHERKMLRQQVNEAGKTLYPQQHH